MKRLCTICARGGSKGVPGKNLRMIAGRPLIAWTIERALACGQFDCVAVSSDSQDILNLAGGCWAIPRPAELASDEAPKLPAIRHAARAAETASGIRFDTLVDLDCTSPLRIDDDIASAIMRLETGSYGNIISVTPARHLPDFNMLKLIDGIPEIYAKPYNALTRRQGARAAFDCNASIIAWKRDVLFCCPIINDATGLYVMPRERSIDIDDELDFKIVEMLLKERIADDR